MENNRMEEKWNHDSRLGFDLLFLLVLSFVCMLPSVSLSTVQLPVEVMGAPPHIESVTVELTDGQVSVAKSLWLELHNVAYENKAQVSINEGDWFMLWNDTSEVKVHPKALAYGGFRGGFHTVQCTIDASHFTLQTGANTVEFKYPEKHPDYATAGYRVVGLNFLDGAGENVLPPKTFVWDDPLSWKAPLSGADDIKAGEKIWRSASTSLNCMDCHTQDGFDLKYFNISNKTIIEQCKKSGFSEKQGKQVASYIRSLDYEVLHQARPWNPPYQPGPKIESQPNAAYAWAAGAGLDAILETDQEMIVELFAKENPSEEWVMKVINDYKTIPNVRTQRISVQFPDWLSWISPVHPKDILPEEKGVLLDQAYNDLRANLEKGNLNTGNEFERYNKNNIFKELADFARKIHIIIKPYAYQDVNPNSPNWTEYNGVSESAKRALSSWYAVKMFEVINEFNLHTIDYVNIEEQDPFQWPSREWSVFQNAAHILAIPRFTSYFSTDKTEAERRKSIYLSSIWYQLQLVLTPGNQLGGVVHPNDWSYNLNHVHKLGYRTGIYEPARFLQNYWMAAAQRNNGVLPKECHKDNERMSNRPRIGWNMREASPWRLYGRATPDTAGEPVDLTLRELDKYDKGMQGRIQSAFYRATANVLNGFNYDQNNGDFTRISIGTSTAPRRTDYQLEDRLAVPEYGKKTGSHKSVFADRRKDRTGVSDAVEIDAAYTLVLLMHQDRIVSKDAFNAIKGWVDKAWDTSKWEDWPTGYTPKED